MQGAIAEALSTSEVAERIWAAAPNRFCADCGAAQPDWASINLCVVICKRCAGRCVCMHQAGCWAAGGLLEVLQPLYLRLSQYYWLFSWEGHWPSVHGYTLPTGMGTHKKGKGIFFSQGHLASE